MTAFRSLLKDEELAAVLTFVRNTWDNQASPIRPETVKKVRAEDDRPHDVLEAGRSTGGAPVGGGSCAERHRDRSGRILNKALEDELLSASPAELAKGSIEKGNVERGKELFYKSAAACFACHDPPSGAIRLGPDLTKVKTALKNEDLVDSILRPSKLIDKEFAQVTCLRDGKQYTGVRISENDNEIVLRNLAQPEPITIKKEDVDEVPIPNVADAREFIEAVEEPPGEFNDLMKYIIEIRKR